MAKPKQTKSAQGDHQIAKNNGANQKVKKNAKLKMLDSDSTGNKGSMISRMILMLSHMSSSLFNNRQKVNKDFEESVSHYYSPYNQLYSTRVTQPREDNSSAPLIEADSDTQGPQTGEASSDQLRPLTDQARADQFKFEIPSILFEGQSKTSAQISPRLFQSTDTVLSGTDQKAQENAQDLPTKVGKNR